MSTEPIPIPKVKEPINLLTEVFLKSVHFLDSDLTKCIVIGIFKNRGNELGVLFKGRKNNVYWSYDIFCQLCDRFNEVTLALMGKYQCYIKPKYAEPDTAAVGTSATDTDSIDTSNNIKVCNVFGNHYACVCDGEHSVTLNSNEWDQLIKNIPLICRSLLELFYLEDEIKVYIDQVLSDSESRTDQLPPHIADRLYGEVSLCKVL